MNIALGGQFSPKGTIITSELHCPRGTIFTGEYCSPGHFVGGQYSLQHGNNRILEQVCVICTDAAVRAHASRACEQRRTYVHALSLRTIDSLDCAANAK